MDHRLVCDIEKALGWSGPERLGREFARGSLPDPALCERLLTPAGLLDLVMRRSLTAARLRCLQDGTDVHPHAYLTSRPMRRAEAVQMADMQRLGLLLKEGCTLILDAVNSYDPTLEIACRALQWWAHELVQVNTYLTTGSTRGFELHWDDHDVIVVQLAGEKSWEVRGLSRPVPMYRDAVPNTDSPDEVLWAGTMQPGDVMHIPRGYWHQATRHDQGNGYSLHLTFGFPQQTGVDFLLWLADQSREREMLRHDVDRWGSAEARSRQHRIFTDVALELVATSSLSGFLDAREQALSPARHVETHGLFGEPMSVACVTEFPPALELHEELVSVRAAAKEITMAAKALPALRLLLSGQPVVIEEVTATTGVNAAELGSVLVAEGICAEVTPALAAGYAGLLR